ncbi:MAG TPA: hypothetical protein VFT05_00865 [Burkholderiaceae bacterium]|nr:hypothetical protein [Burkholderiaceae bacterium]
MRYLDFSSWEGAMTTLVGLAVFTLLGVGIRVLMMQTVQHRRERMNRQINERLRTLISAYRALGGSFTGELTVDPTHLRDLRTAGLADGDAGGSDRARRIRDAVEAALADIILLGTEQQCRLAGQAAADMAAGRPIHTADLVISLRNFIREALDLEPIPADVAIPLQGPTRSAGGAGRGKGEAAKGSGRGGAGGSGGGMGLDAGHAPGEHEPGH